MLWIQYLDFCASMKSTRILSRTIAKAIQLHPYEVGLWIRGANFEFFENCNPSSARILMQRAIRINETSQMLWMEYFRMEFLYIQKLRGRQEILKLGADSAGNGEVNGEERGERMDVPELEEEKGMEPIEAEKVLETKVEEEFYKGAIPLIVYKHAVEAIPKDLEFRLQFWKACQDFPDSEQVADYIMQDMEKAFADTEDWWHVKALLTVEGDVGHPSTDQPTKGHKRRRSEPIGPNSFPTAKILDVIGSNEKAALLILEEGVMKLGTPKMWECYLDFLSALSGKMAARAGVVDKVLESTFHRAEEEQKLTAKSYAIWIEWLEKEELWGAVEEVVNKGTKAFGTRGDWLLSRVRALRSLGKRKEVSGILEGSLKLMDKSEEDYEQLWNLWLDVILESPEKEEEEEREEDSAGDIQTACRAFERAIGYCREKGAGLSRRYVTWAMEKGGKALFRKAVDAVGLLLPSSGGEGWPEFFQMALDTEGEEDVKRCRLVNEMAVKMCPTSEDLWERYERSERERGEHKRANAIKHRASAALS